MNTNNDSIRYETYMPKTKLEKGKLLEHLIDRDSNDEAEILYQKTRHIIEDNSMVIKK